jgi:hypothetical protein
MQTKVDHTSPLIDVHMKPRHPNGKDTTQHKVTAMARAWRRHLLLLQQQHTQPNTTRLLKADKL